MSESTPLVPRAIPRKRAISTHLQSPTTQRTLLTLITISALCVLIDLSWNVLNPSCGHTPQPRWLTYLSTFSLLIDSVFLLEIPLSLYAFGAEYYGLSWSKKPVPHFALHLFDALIILGTVVFEVILSGKERELAGLLVLLRLWRIVKLVGGVASGVGAWDAATVSYDAEARIKQLEEENAWLRRVYGVGGGVARDV